mmetsp:Transcript_30728/g.46573  ORF Transcript_30728/g.46573 Transcript_30728/m.46573 type:complete len:215 (-) Transcript_30728:264-908(-)|eukprot:CAMPEP_0178925672 /NCGR_PEP_ID=MMETSP0786-20121207/18053_1 /TAXON_ID=186022 /ORGANISM="Thalassionema frauenfeldii, Strain CCMP 1798" /LENGTH=214 /DNA_ID=CAMNT_0020600601 /DNA_START=45 /DNA_END=689 /DNA_ORIENTATION=+
MKITPAIRSTGVLSSLILCLSLTRCIGLENGFSLGVSRRLRLPSSFNDFVNGFSQTPELEDNFQQPNIENFYSGNEQEDTDFYEDLANMNGDQYGSNHNTGDFYGGGGGSQRPNGGYGGRPEGFGSSRPRPDNFNNFDGDDYSEGNQNIASVAISATGSGSASAGSGAGDYGTNHRPQYGGWREGDAQLISASPSLLSHSFVGFCMIASALFLF